MRRSTYGQAAEFIKQREVLTALDDDLTWEEFMAAVPDLKNDKSPGLNGVPPHRLQEHG